MGNSHQTWAPAHYSGNQRGRRRGKVALVHWQSESSPAFHACCQRVSSRECLPRSEYYTITAGGMRTAEITSIKQTSFSGQVKFGSSHPWQNPSKIFALEGINSQEVIKSVTLFRAWEVLCHTPALLVFHTIHLKPLSPRRHLKRKFPFSSSLKLPWQKPTGWAL